jgi:hypothetical protein
MLKYNKQNNQPCIKYEDLLNLKWEKYVFENGGKSYFLINGMCNIFHNNIELYAKKDKYSKKIKYTLECNFDSWGESGFTYDFPLGVNIHKAKKETMKIIKNLIENEDADFYF